MTVPEDENRVLEQKFLFSIVEFFFVVSLPLAYMVWRVLVCMSRVLFFSRVRVFSVFYMSICDCSLYPKLLG